MSRRTLGIGLLVAGGIIALVGVVGLVAGGGDSEVAATPGTTTVPPAEEAPDTTLPPVTTSLAATTTTQAPATTSTTVPPTTTTTIDPAAEIEAFVPDFAAAIAAGDVDYLFATLHPVVVDLFGEELCRSFIEREILELRDYRLTGAVTGPNTDDIGGTSVTTFSAPVSFGFQGENFDATASFALEDGVRWFAECR